MTSLEKTFEESGFAFGACYRAIADSWWYNNTDEVHNSRYIIFELNARNLESIVINQIRGKFFSKNRSRNRATEGILEIKDSADKVLSVAFLVKEASDDADVIMRINEIMSQTYKLLNKINRLEVS